MFTTYLKTAWRTLSRNKGAAFINIGGLTVGMAVTMLIGLWIWDELSFDRYNPNYPRIAQVMTHVQQNNETGTNLHTPYVLGAELRNSFGSDFKYVVMSTNDYGLTLSAEDKNLSVVGRFMEPGVTDMLDLQMVSGVRDGLQDPSSILISQSTAKAVWGAVDPVGGVMKINNKQAVKVTGVYQDLPDNSSFANLAFIAPWDQYVAAEDLPHAMDNPWNNNSWQTYVQLADHAAINTVSQKIKDVKLRHVDADQKVFKPQVFLEPMRNWHLYNEFKNGVHAGGRIQYVWLFGIIGAFVLLLACINFMNLSTARSEKRAREVGIRKAIGSVRGQLVFQFFSESLLVAAFAFLLSLLLVQLALPFFNEVADKRMTILWGNPWFWVLGIGFSVVTGLFAGSYPAFYLSSFKPVRVLKGVFRVGRSATVPRKVLVVVQFTVSVVLIIGTIVVFRQIQFAKERPVGYSREGLIAVQPHSSAIHDHFEAVKDELVKSGAILSMAETWSPVTSVWATNSGFDWKGKDPAMAVEFPNNGVSVDYGKTIGWQFTAGRDFSPVMATDSAAFVVNESAVKFMRLTNPVGQTIRWNGYPFTIIGVVKDAVAESPYEPVRPSVFHLYAGSNIFTLLRINPAKPVRDALLTVEQVFGRFNPGQPFAPVFIDEEYNQKFRTEERTGKLAGFFAALAIFISCLGLFGIASFMAEQRTKEIGIRKVLGASVTQVWSLLSRDFMLMVLVAFLIATPIAWYAMHRWLESYTYHAAISWWMFAVTGLGALLLTLATVSYQSIRAGMANPVKSLKAE
jgi:ABC-type antimicrobial peptide transport system permease subunit